MTPDQLTDLARGATEALLAQKPFTVVREAGAAREGFPLPIKRMPAQPDGSVVQDYRPLAVLEYVQDYLSGELQGRLMRERRSAETA